MNSMNYLDKYKEYALVYLVTRKEGFKGNLFILRIDDAKKLCFDKCSSGGSWMFQWTALAHFIDGDQAADTIKTRGKKMPPFVFIKDTGKQDKDFDRLGIHKPSKAEITEILQGAGFEFKEK